MKFKKVFASCVVAVMAFSSIASAATTVDDAHTTPKIDIAVEKLEDETSINDVAGAAYLKRNPYDEAAYDYYKITYTFTELGELRNDAFEDILAIYNISFGLNTDQIVSAGIKSSAIEKTSTAVGQDARPGYEQYFNMTMTAQGGTENPFPAANMDNLEQEQEFNGSIVIPFVVAINDGTSVVVDDFYHMITYIVDNKGQYENFEMTTPDSITIGTLAPEPAELDMTVDFNGKYNNGYVWTANITKGENDIDSFTAKFTAGAETADRAITNVEDMVGKFTGEGTLSFNIGLDTTKTLTGAEFTVGADAESKTVAAPLE